MLRALHGILPLYSALILLHLASSCPILFKHKLTWTQTSTQTSTCSVMNWVWPEYDPCGWTQTSTSGVMNCV